MRAKLFTLKKLKQGLNIFPKTYEGVKKPFGFVSTTTLLRKNKFLRLLRCDGFTAPLRDRPA
jgi:hypothetical protein